MKWTRAGKKAAAKREYVSTWAHWTFCSCRYFVGRVRREVWYAAFERYTPEDKTYTRGFLYPPGSDQLWFASKRAAMAAAAQDENNAGKLTEKRR